MTHGVVDIGVSLDLGDALVAGDVLKGLVVKEQLVPASGD
jgi:hypothetical protein